MKTLICRALSGPCDHRHHGESAVYVINAKAALREAMVDGHTAHERALAKIIGRWKLPMR